MCNRRLDSTLLVEHDGLPLCRNCHRSYLGQGKGGFAKAVPVRGTLPTSPPRMTVASPPGAVAVSSSTEDDLASRITGISITSKGDSRESNAPSLVPTFSGNLPTRKISSAHATSIDDMFASEYSIPDITSRNEALRHSTREISSAVGGDEQSDKQRDILMSSRKFEAALEPSESSYRIHLPDDSHESESSCDSLSQRAIEQSLAQTGSHTAKSSPPPLSSSSPTQRLPSPIRKKPVSSSEKNYKTVNGNFTSPCSLSGVTGNVPSASSPFRSQYISLTTTPMRLSNAIGSGTPLCARCSKPAYFAEAVQGATTGGRVWHRACLKCEGCGSTLQKGTLEEGPTDEAMSYGDGMNTFCKTCYKKLFGPRGIGSAGTSFPTAGR